MDLIFAEATPPGRGGVSVIRLSGRGSRVAAEALAGPLPKPRHAYFRDLCEGDEALDQGLVLWFAEGASFAGEESSEPHLHGAPVIVRRVARALTGLGARPAEAGEFTRRAFLNGRIGLTEIEGLGDLLLAETELQRKQAVLAASGHFGQRVDHWRGLILRAGGLTESSIDFADEDVPEDVPDEVFSITKELAAEIDREISGFGAAERIRCGFEVAVIGPPNAGKSSLINALARREVAIVSDMEGTTRDIIEVRLDLAGMAVTFLDTAGLRETADDVERLGVDRGRLRADTADLRVHVGAGTGGVADLWKNGDLAVSSKADIRLPDTSLAVSATTGEGLDILLRRVMDELKGRISGAGLVSHERQLKDLKDARDAQAGLEGRAPELVAEHLRMAATALDRAIGRIEADDYLDVVFSSFCIGK